MEDKKITDYWAMTKYPIRQTQQDALEFIEDAVKKGYDYFLLDAPTGSGKSSIGVTLSNWATRQGKFDLYKSAAGAIVQTYPGSYYITPQNLLQDQLINDAAKGEFFGKFGDIRASSHYQCQQCSGNCSVGSTVGCMYKEEGKCTYDMKKYKFMNADTSITNSAYLLNEFFHSHRLPPKNLLIVDEAHRLESELASVNELSIYVQAEHVKTDLIEFNGNSVAWALWMKRYYMPYLTQQIKDLEKIVNSQKGNWLEAANRVVNQKRKLSALYRIMDDIQQNNGKFIQYEQKFTSKSVTYIVKPLQVASYAIPFLEKRAKYKLFMSASIENAKNFSAYTGIEEKKIAYCKIPSQFPIENRPIYYNPVGSMGYKNKKETLPKLLDRVSELFDKYPDKKGIIHCQSYTLGQELFTHLDKTKHRDRVLYHPNGDYREDLYKQHINSSYPTVIITPAMNEGFDFKNDLARFQIIPKMPYPNLSDPYIKAKADESWAWYSWEAVKSLIQATGRIVRHEKDYGDTYILDSDLKQLVQRSAHLFPEWWSDAVISI